MTNYKSYNSTGYWAWYNDKHLWHNIYGPTLIFDNIFPDHYYIDGKYYNNFIEYIKAVITYKENENVKKRNRI